MKTPSPMWDLDESGVVRVVDGAAVAANPARWGLSTDAGEEHAPDGGDVDFGAWLAAELR